MATTANQKTDKADGREESGASPLVDSTEAAVKKMIAKAKERGYISYDDLDRKSVV